MSVIGLVYPDIINRYLSRLLLSYVLGQSRFYPSQEVSREAPPVSRKRGKDKLG